MPKSTLSGGSSSGSPTGSSSNNNEQLFPPLNYSRSYFTQWLLKDTEDCLLWKDPPSHHKNSHHHHQNNSHSHSTRSSAGGSPHHVKRNNMELIQLLAINALEFTAPVYSFLNKDCNKPSPVVPTDSPDNGGGGDGGGGNSANVTETPGQTESAAELRKGSAASLSAESRQAAATSSKPNLTPKSSVELSKELKLNREFIQLSGHPGSFAPAGPTTIWKKMPNDSFNEASIYEKLRDDSPSDPLRLLIPTYISRTEWNGSIFIELEDLVTRFNLENLNIMDLKLGIRTFLESEVTNTKPRSDLYDKMVKIDPHGPTEEEHVTKSVTKLRYMQFREELSSTKRLGFRIEGVKLSDKSKNETVKKVNLQRLKEEKEIIEILKNFVGKFASEFLKKLTELRENLEKSDFFMSHEIIGCSLLLIHDNDKFGAWIIDFAKTFEVDKITHRAGWTMGNREDGVLTGVDNVIRLLKLV